MSAGLMVPSTIPTIAATSMLAMVCAAEARGVDTVDVLRRAKVDRAF